MCTLQDRLLLLKGNMEFRGFAENNRFGMKAQMKQWVSLGVRPH